MNVFRSSPHPENLPGPDLDSIETDAANAMEMILIAQADARILTEAAPPSRELLNRHRAVLCVAQDQLASLQAQLAFAAAELAQRAPIDRKGAA